MLCENLLYGSAPIPEMLNGEDHYAYLLGYEDGTVRPNGSISRAEVATVLFRLLKDDVRMQNLTKDNAYSDVSDTAWYAAAVSTLSKMGVISGYPDGTFRPNEAVTRAQAAVMLYGYAAFTGADVTARADLSAYSDAGQIPSWAMDAMQWANARRLIVGRDSSHLVPDGKTTRAEMAAILSAYIGK